MRGEFVDVGNQRLYYYAAGTRGSDSRPPVVLIHGFPTSSRLWHLVSRDFPAGHRLIVVDLPGYGRSDPVAPHDAADPIEHAANALLSLFDELGVSATALVGHGLGGAVAQAIALLAPTRTTHLALVDSAAFGVKPQRMAGLAITLEPLTRVAPSGVLAGLVHGSVRRGFADPGRTDLALDACLRPFSSRAGRAVLAGHLRALVRGDSARWSARLGELSLPAAVIHGREDPFYPVSLSERLAASIPDASMNVIDGARHFVPEDTPDQLVRHLTALLAR